MVLQVLSVSNLLVYQDILTFPGTQEGKKLEKGGIFDRQHYYKAKTFTKVRGLHSLSHFIA